MISSESSGSGRRGVRQTEDRRRLVRGLSNLFDRPDRIILIRHGESLGNVDDRYV